MYDDQDEPDVNIVVNEDEEAGVQDNGRVIVDEEEDEIQDRSGPEPQMQP